MSSLEIFYLAVPFLPLVIFFAAFHRSWQDKALIEATLVGIISGAGAAGIVKYMAYPFVNVLLGIDLRTFVVSMEDPLAKALVCVFLIGSIEEGAKLSISLALLAIFNFLGRAPAIFLAALGAGLGFSVVENIAYFNIYGLEVLFAREVISTTGHVVFSGIVGLAAAYSLFTPAPGQRRGFWKGYGILVTGLFFAAIFHGLFNFIALTAPSWTSIPILFLLLVFMVNVMYEAWTRMLLLDEKRQASGWLCSNCGLKNFGIERFCPTCGSRVQTQ